MRSVSSDSGAVTAEFMLLMPAVILLGGLVSLLFGLSIDLVALQRQAGGLVRELAIGRELVLPQNTQAKTWNQGRLVCIQLSRPGLIKITAEQCAMPLA